MNEKSITLDKHIYIVRELNMLESIIADGFAAKLAGDSAASGMLLFKVYAVSSIRSVDGKTVSPLTSYVLFQSVAQDISHSASNDLITAYSDFMPKPGESPNDQPPEQNA